MKYRLLLTATLAASLVPCTLLAQNAAPAGGDGAKPTVDVDKSAVNRNAPLTTSFAPIVEKVMPSVVSVSTSKKPGQDMQNNPLFNDPLFRRFFGPGPGGPGDGGGGGGGGGGLQGLGSGVVVSKEGHILTNNHVVEGADEIMVTQDSPRRELKAKVIGTDPSTDLAVLKVEAADLSPITFGDDASMRVGDVVLAVGNPFGVGQAVTMGIISALGRGNIGIVDYENFIQTDASINPGNSGGALVDTEGRLVGINTAILSRTGGNQGVGFAVPASLVQGVLKSIVEKGKVTRGYLGVMIQPLTPELAENFDTKTTSGALVSDVKSGSPADKAGLKIGDVITEVNGKPVPDARQLRLTIGQTAPGTKADLKVMRGGKDQSVQLEVGELPGKGELASRGGSSTAPAKDEGRVLKGVMVNDLDPSLRRQLDLPPGVIGPVVTAVEPGSSAYRAGLREGDVIQEIDRQPVKSADDAIQIANKAGGKRVLLLIYSKGGTRFLIVNNDE